MSDIAKRHPHYHKDVTRFNHIDVYRVLELFNVTDPCMQHAIKKLLVAGGRGAGKDIQRDIQEAIDSLERWKEMRAEEQTGGMLAEAQNRLFDLVLGDDGHAYKEARRYLERERPDLYARLHHRRDVDISRDGLQP